ncbi:hypothetical protein NQ315_006803 [Exocentrus adspersus]|uniref:Uncharacterized protein n=1 Tax=Exocentrus adspersus TaxID=1586481 RepID=A0AAV8WEC9_9CUCU|nr:hypothetical protein NQ315_006803 [Exocentrus adspersus]
MCGYQFVINLLVSGVECKDEIYSASQFSPVKSETPNNSTPKPVVEIVVSVVDDNNKVLEVPPKPISTTTKLFGNINKIDKESENVTRPLTATTKIFGPRTKDMNEGFLGYSEDDSGLLTLTIFMDLVKYACIIAKILEKPREKFNFMDSHIILTCWEISSAMLNDELKIVEDMLLRGIMHHD